MLNASKAMQAMRRALVCLGMLGCASMVGGCAAAPSIPVAGAYFPAWLVCSLIGVLGMIVARVVLVGAGLGQALPLQLLVCLSVGIVFAAAMWAAWVLL